MSLRNLVLTCGVLFCGSAFGAQEVVWCNVSGGGWLSQVQLAKTFEGLYDLTVIQRHSADPQNGVHYDRKGLSCVFSDLDMKVFSCENEDGGQFAMSKHEISEFQNGALITYTEYHFSDKRIGSYFEEECHLEK